ncbi:MAG: hypothetical protein JXR37_32900 [Kiritimatiellae bacterium]|nr:hypothetical protein [Kiritimatiellia bacterium]
MAGTDPTNAASRLLTGLDPVTGATVDLLIDDSITGRVYDVEYCTNLVEANWLE